MPDPLFSSARIRAYGIIESAGLGPARDVAIQNTLIGSHLWLPISLVEVVFRNRADRVVSEFRPEGKAWLFDKDGGSDVFRAADVVGAPWLYSKRDDGTVEDPVRIAARMAAVQSQRDEITRDDVIAYLMLGFWTVRVPKSLQDQLDVFEGIASDLPAPIETGEQLQQVMVHNIHRIRNRIAHHEPLLFQRKHVIESKTGVEKSGLGLIDSLQGAINAFMNEADKVVQVAKAMVPAAATHLDSVLPRLRGDIEPLATKLDQEAARLRKAREARIAEGRSST